LGVSQAKLAYILDTEGINQNTISRYEHKYIVTADVEYILWKWLLNEINKTWKKSKSGMSRFMALYIGGYQLYILRYANNKQAYMLQSAMIEAYRMLFNA
jgi:predicted Ser/Thr protein kinase